MADLTPAQAKELADAYQKALKISVDLSKKAQLVYLATKNTKSEANAVLGLRQQVMKTYATEYAALKKIAETNKALASIEAQRLKTLVNMDVELEKQESILNNINLQNEKARKIQDQELDIMRKKGQMLRAYLSDLKLSAKRAFQTESGHTTATSVAQGTAKTGAGGIGIAQDPKQMLQALGPWGIIIGFIADIIDGVRMMGGELHKASAESGKFADSFENTRKESQNLFSNQIELMTRYGLTVKEAGQIYGELKSTGLEALGVIPQTGDALNNLALDVMSFAKATNQSTAQVAEQYAQIVRTFGKDSRNAKQLTDTYNKIFTVASKAADAGFGKMSELVSTVFSLGEAFKDVGMSADSVVRVVNGMTGALKSLKFAANAADINRIASGILGITKASEGWQVFMGKLSGMSGGYAQTLFQMQQRGSDFALPGAGKFDAGKTIQSFRGMLNATTGGISDPMTKQLMIEKMGQQVGMDTQTTQVFQRLMSGGMDEGAAKSDLEKIHKAAIDNNMSTKGMFDMLKEILVGMIAKPILFIWKLLARWKGTDKEKEAAKKMGDAFDKVDQPQEKTSGIRHSAIGSDVTRSGLMMVHAGNQVVPMAKAQPFKDRMRAGGAGGGVNLSFNVMIDEKSLHKKFMQMEQQTLDLLHKQQKGNF
jgi:hypothetical protein